MTDQVNAIVMEFGDRWIKVGWAGEDTPRLVFPTFVGYVPTTAGTKPSEGLDSHSVPNSRPISPTNQQQLQQQQPGKTGQLGDIEMADATSPNQSQPTSPVQADRLIAKSNKSFKRKWIIGDGASNCFKPGMEVKNPVKDGQIEDWEAFEAILDYIYHIGLRIDPAEYPLLIIEPSFTTDEVLRQKLAEILFEKFNVPALYVAKAATMAAYAMGKGTALVVDIGASRMSVVPVHDGYILRQAIQTQKLGGNFITSQARIYFEQTIGYVPIPPFLISKKKMVDRGSPVDVTKKKLTGLTNSFMNMSITRVFEDWKESMCDVLGTRYDDNEAFKRPTEHFEFSDGFNMPFGSERFKLPEILFNPKEFTIPSPSQPLSQNASSFEPLHKLITLTLTLCKANDPNIGNVLASNIIMTGGSSLFDRLPERLSYELNNDRTWTGNIHVHASGVSTERKFGNWIGGSILASLGAFQGMWLAKSEFESGGVDELNRRCPM